MRGHDQSSHRVRRRAWSGVIVLVAAIAATRTAPGQDEAAREIDAGRPVSQARDPIDLAARWVRVWEQGGVQWVMLSGQAAVLQGVEGIRADEVVARITPVPGEARTNYRVDFYAEGVIPVDGQGRSGRTMRSTLGTDSQVRLRPYDRNNVDVRKGAPGGFRLLARSGLLPDASTAAKPPKVNASSGASNRANRPVAGQPDGATSGARSSVPPQGMMTNAERLEGAPVELPELTAVPGSGPVASVVAASGQSRQVVESVAKIDPEVVPAQFAPPNVEGTDDPTRGQQGDVLPPPAEASELDSAPTVPTIPSDPVPGQDAPGQGTTTELAPLPAPGTEDVEAKPSPPDARNGRGRGRAAAPANPLQPMLPGSQRVTRIAPRNGGPDFSIERLPISGGLDTTIIRGGVNLIIESAKQGVLDISADSVVIWRKVDAEGKSVVIRGPNGEEIENSRQPMEVYLEGNVVISQDERKVAGNGDQRVYRAKQAYYDIVTDRFVGLDAELNLFAPGLIAPARVFSPRIDQYRPLERGADGKLLFGPSEIRANQTTSTGSRFPNPGYKIKSRSIDVYKTRTRLANPNSGTPVTGRDDPNPPEDLTSWIDARQNFFFMGPIPVFYWPRIFINAEDVEPPLRQITFRTNNYFGQQLLTDFNGFRLIGVKKPKNIDIWNVDVDYLSRRTKVFPALGSEIGWFGSDLFNDIRDPYDKVKGEAPSITKDYFGYLDIWGLRDYGNDVLGSGPAIITDNRAAGQKGFQRGGGGLLGSVPSFTPFRGRINARHMQRLIPDDDEHLYEDFRLQLEVGYYTDRYFLEEYYKYLFDTGLDQETLGYLFRSHENTAWSVRTSANTQNWQTQTQWLPRLDYYRLGDSFLDLFTYFQHSGVDYANVHVASEVNNPYIFAFLPYDPITNTSRAYTAGRAYTNHELDLKLNIGNVLRVVPYAQGQLQGWSNQINGQPLGRVWGAGGVRADATAYKKYEGVDSELWNVHGLNHKINFEADFRSAYSNVNLNQIGVQDTLDDNTYETVRRYFALTNYSGGILPEQYDPRHLILRRTLSPITGPTDIQATIETLHMGIHQRLQTKRGPEGRRRIIDYMTLDLDTTYFPNAARDNFNKPFGQNMYNWQWFVGDRTSIISYGWFEFFNIGGTPTYQTNINRNNNPFGLNVITSGVSISRPPRGNIFVGYTVIDSGPINTSALTTSMSYWLSPKWYGTYSTMYDFGDAILLNAMFSVTRIGADYLTTVGLTVDPQRQSYMFAFQVSPRLSPNVQLGSGVGMSSFDSRYAPTQ